MAGLVSVVVGGQFGSEAKGAVAGFLASEQENSRHQWQDNRVVCVRVGGPNAGHTVYGRCPIGCVEEHDALPASEARHPWRLRQVPVAAVTNPSALLLIAAGSEVDFEVLRSEMVGLNSAGYHVHRRLHIDQSATVLTSKHIEAEMVDGLNGKIGSTAKGIGAARADRLWRKAQTVRDFAEDMGIAPTDSTTFLANELERGAHVVIEGTQGYGLGLHTKYYPTVTSGDCRAIDFLAQCGISPWASYVEELAVWVVARTYPIRVAGASGPLKDELSWQSLGLPEERTTVTQNVRRVGDWDPELVKAAVLANGGGDGGGPVHLALTMVDYKIPEIKGISNWDDLGMEEKEQLGKLINSVQTDVWARVDLVGTGPTSLIDLR